MDAPPITTPTPPARGAELRRVTESWGGRAAAAILREAATWAAQQGIDVWRLDELQDADFERAAAAGEVVLGFEGAEVAATMLLQSADPVYWPDDPPGAALYVHKVGVRRASAGRGWLARIIEFAAAEARRQGAPYLRLDTVNRAKMRQMYEQLGFRWIPEEPLLKFGRQIIRLERRL